MYGTHFLYHIFLHYKKINHAFDLNNTKIHEKPKHPLLLHLIFATSHFAKNQVLHHIQVLAFLALVL